jgi:DNA-binding MarR family transcriptional regulator
MRDVAKSGSVTALLAGFGDLDSTLTRESLLADASTWRGGHLSQSLLRGLLVLSCLPPDGGYRENLEVAKTLGISPSTTHRYMSTLVALGFVERNPNSRQYRRVANS